jgi:hypothetical protein
MGQGGSERDECSHNLLTHRADCSSQTPLGDERRLVAFEVVVDLLLHGRSVV